MSSAVFFVEVDSSDLSRVLKHLCRLEKQSPTMRVGFASDQLSITCGNSLVSLSATGSWPRRVVVSRQWGEALAIRPIAVAVVPLRIEDGKLFTRDYGVSCRIEDDLDEDRIFRRQNVNSALEALGSYRITEKDLHQIIDSADSEGFRWGAGDAGVIKDIADAWKHLADHGIEPDQIRQLVNTKLRNLLSETGAKRAGNSDENWSPRRLNVLKALQTLGRYHITEEDLNRIIDTSDSKSNEWRAREPGVIQDVAEAWKHLAYHGVDPYQIGRLLASQLREPLRDTEAEKPGRMRSDKK